MLVSLSGAAAADMPAGKAATEAAGITGLNRRTLYDRLLALKAER